MDIYGTKAVLGTASSYICCDLIVLYRISSPGLCLSHALNLCLHETCSTHIFAFLLLPCILLLGGEMASKISGWRTSTTNPLTGSQWKNAFQSFAPTKPPSNKGWWYLAKYERQEVGAVACVWHIYCSYPSNCREKERGETSPQVLPKGAKIPHAFTEP